MGEYGLHPTQYGKLNNEQLFSMFRESIYSKLSENEKLNLLQEIVNRDAQERGEIGTPKVCFSNLPVNESGNAANGVISINYNLAVKGIQVYEYNGQVFQHVIADYNCQTLNTVLHENAHCFQEQVIDGTIHINNNQLVREYQANRFIDSVVFQNGSYQLGSQYLRGKTANGYYMYYFQATERDAYLSAEQKTNAILRDISERYGTEASFETYLKSILITGYEAVEQEAMQRFQNSNFVYDLNQTLQNQYYETNIPVDIGIENDVKAEMIATYQSLQQKITTTEETKMLFDSKPVSLEEYNQTLRDAVNTYYEHAVNVSSMSKDEAIQSTAEMSEKYLSAVQEFQEAQEIQSNEQVDASESVQAMELNEIQTNGNAIEVSDIQEECDSSLNIDNVESEISDDGMVDSSENIDDGINI